MTTTSLKSVGIDDHFRPKSVFLFRLSVLFPFCVRVTSFLNDFFFCPCVFSIKLTSVNGRKKAANTTRTLKKAKLRAQDEAFLLQKVLNAEVLYVSTTERT